MSWLRTTGLRVLLALGLGFALWSYVSYRENPERSTSFNNVPVGVEGVSPGLVVVDQNGVRAVPPAIDVTVEADTDTLANVSAANLEAYVDVSGRGPGDYLLPVNVRSTRSDLRRLTFASEPDFLPIRLEQVVTRTVPLDADVSGDVPFSFEKLAEQVTWQGREVSEVQVSGPQSLVERVDRARASVSVNGLTANYNSSRPVEPVAEDGQLIVGVATQPSTVQVLVPIVSSAGVKRVPVVPQVTGQPASGYVITEILVDPAFVTLVGSSGPLDDIQNIETQTIDVSGVRGVITRTVELVDLPGASLRAGQSEQVVVTVRSGPIDRPFRVTLPVPVTGINAPGGLNATVSPGVVQLTLSGTAERLAGIDSEDIQGFVSLEGLAPGVYTLTPAFNLPDGVSVVGSPRVTATLRLQASPTPQPAPTNEPTEQPAPTNEPTEPPATPTTGEPTSEPAAPAGSTALPTAPPPGG